LDEEKQRILSVLADDWDANPSNRSNGIHFRRLGALVGAYLNFPIYSVAALEREGLVSKIGNMVILTVEGYSRARGHAYGVSQSNGNRSWWRLSNPLVYVILTATAAVIAGLILLLFNH